MTPNLPLRRVAALVIAGTLAATLLGSTAPSARTRGRAARPCPRVSKLVYPANPTAAFPAAKKAAGYGSNAEIKLVRRGDRAPAPYATMAKRQCGSPTRHRSIYVQVHPRGQTCAACDLRAFLVKYRHGGWSVWTAF